MTETNNHPKPAIFSARRLTLLGSVAVLGSALMFGGPLEFGHLTQPAFAATTSQQQGPTGFADLIAKAKPAVISVRVKIEQTAATDKSMSEELPPS
jgi:serine protease Do